MNIFATDQDPIKSALWLDDVRANKMILESAQMLSTAIRVLDQSDHPIYKPTHSKHPCTLWAWASRENFDWLCEHMEGLLSRKPNHKSGFVLDYARGWVHNSHFSQISRTQFANCARNLEVGVDFSEEKNVHTAYRKYMKARWKRDTIRLSWDTGEKPEWMMIGGQLQQEFKQLYVKK